MGRTQKIILWITGWVVWTVLFAVVLSWAMRRAGGLGCPYNWL